MGENFGNKYD